MKKMLLVLFIIPINLLAQNVGVNLINPKYTLDVNGKLAIKKIDYIDYKDTVLYQDPNTGEIKKTMIQGFGFVVLNNDKLKIKKPKIGLTLYCKDCMANDKSTGVMQTYNGNRWKNNW